ncbi:phage tail protein [Escherichia coli]|uniref:gp53-like domain-containing protein n=1 Tax=Escherichia coli TaxID=562 RepID=UPI0039811E6A
MPFARYFCIFINVGLGEGSPAIGVPFFWPSAAMPNTVIDSWSSMVFLKFNGAKLPDGTIIQMGISASGPLGSPVNITLPISFSNTNYCVVASYDNARSGVSTMVSFAALPVSPSQFSLMSSVTEQGINPFAYWIAFGD